MKKNKLIFYSFIIIILIMTVLGTYLAVTTVIENSENGDNDNNNNNSSYNNNTDDNLDNGNETVESINRSMVEDDYNKNFRDFINGPVTNIKRNESLDSIARYKSNDMAENDYLSPESPDGEKIRDIFETEGVSCSVYGINIASTFYNKKIENNVKYTSSDELAEGIFTSYTSDKNNTENLVNDEFEQYGVGVSITDDNEVYHTQVFCSK